MSTEKTCEGHWIEDGGPFGKTKVCVSDFGYKFCRGNQEGFLIMIASLVGVNLFFYLIARMCGSFHSPSFSMIISIFQNVLFSAIFMCITCTQSIGFQSQYMAPLILMTFISLIMNLLTFVTYAKKMGKNKKRPKIGEYRLMMFPNMKEQNNSIDDVESYVKKVVSNPPLIKIKGSCTMTVNQGTRQHFVREVYVDYVPYASWASNTEVPTTSSPTLAVVHVKSKFEFTPSLETTISMRRQHLKDQAANVGFHFEDDKLVEKIFNVKKSRVINNGNCYLKFLNSCFGKFLFILSHVFGLSAVFENLFGIIARKIKVETKRVISDVNNLPIPYLKSNPNIPGGEECHIAPLSNVPHANIQAGQAQANNIYQQSLPPNIVQQPGMPNANQMQAMQMQNMQMQQQMMMQQQQIMMQQQQIQQMQQMQQMPQVADNPYYP